MKCLMKPLSAFAPSSDWAEMFEILAGRLVVFVRFRGCISVKERR